ncbi:MAG: tRNA (adenosine(37)-N6)-dimethylallyltransferase MiaA [Desulfonatronovibrio sp.]
MSVEVHLPKIVCILGPTGSGKNDLALELSDKVELEIINFDSRQVYADLPLITAQPSDEEKNICPHHLYGFLKLEDKISAGRFVDMAEKTISEVLKRGSVPFLVGGTGLYIRSLIYGLVNIPDIPESIYQELEEQCQITGIGRLRQELEKVDPEYSSSISTMDRQKIIRALSVYRTTGISFSDWHKKQNRIPFFNALKIGIWKDLKDLTFDLDKRIGKMIEMGAVPEVEKAWVKSGKDDTCPAFSGIGCREIISMLEGEIDLREARTIWLKKTRAYAKRQLTWFKKEDNVHWFSRKDFSKAENLVVDFLG